MALRAKLVERKPTGTVVVVEIDARSIQAAGQWPWPRERFATAIRNLRNGGATLVGFDVDFSARSSASDDTALKHALEAYPGAIVLPTFMRPGASVETTPLGSLSRDAVAAGVNVELDADGRVRRYWRGFQYPSHYRASMASVLAGAPYGQTAPFFIDFGIRVQQIERISFEDIYNGSFDRARVRGKSVLIGATALELGDRFASPLQPSIPGVFIHALAYESLAQRRTLLAPSWLIVFGLAVLTLLMSWPKPGALDLRALFIRQALVFSAAILVPTALQAAAPISVSLGLVLLAQSLAVVMSVYRELTRRAGEIVRQREAHLSFVALHDPETQLPNRRAMLEHLTRRIDANAAPAGVIVAMAIGIERFPILRGAIGYASANSVVQSLAVRIAQCCRQEPVFHIATSVLGVVMVAESLEAAQAAYAEALALLNTAAPSNGQEIETQTRVGLSLGESRAITAEKLLEQATIALDQSRLQNHRLLIFDENETLDPRLQLTLVSEVDRGLAAGQFSLVYQPKASTRDGAIVGAEALVRWRHPVHGDISPDQFIPVAEETGAIDELTRWVLAQTIVDQARLRAEGVDIVVSVNVSARSLSDSAFCTHVIASVQKSGARLCVEITETAVIADPIAAVLSVAAFREAGIRVSVDDYGSGLSSLAYLKQLAADELKIDKSLVVDGMASARDRLILKSTIDLAHGLGMSVVAEGIEDEAGCAVLAAMGCDAIQGYWVSRPTSLERLTALCLSAPPGGLRDPPQDARAVHPIGARGP